MSAEKPEPKTAEQIASVNYLKSLLNKTLRIQVSDRRLFVGQMKCTDKVRSTLAGFDILKLADKTQQDRNIVLQHAHEYREPSRAAIVAASLQSKSDNGKIVANMSSRYVGLIVVPGEHIEMIQIEEFDPALIK